MIDTKLGLWGNQHISQLPNCFKNLVSLLHQLFWSAVEIKRGIGMLEYLYNLHMTLVACLTYLVLFKYYLIDV
jgi:hypothetical protein